MKGKETIIRPDEWVKSGPFSWPKQNGILIGSPAKVFQVISWISFKIYFFARVDESFKSKYLWFWLGKVMAPEELVVKIFPYTDPFVISAIVIYDTYKLEELSGYLCLI